MTKDPFLTANFFDVLEKSEDPISVPEIASNFQQLCAKFIANDDIQKPTLSSNANFLSMIECEEQTWSLFVVLENCRSSQFDDNVLPDCLPTTEYEVHHHLIKSDRHYRELTIAVDFYQMVASNIFDDRLIVKKFENLPHIFSNALDKIKRENRQEDSLETDAILRSNASHFDAEERESDQRLTDLIFRYLRCGAYNKAIEACCKVGQQIRALPLIQTCVEDDRISLAERSFQRAIQWEAANNESANGRERAIYAILSGRLSRLLPECTSVADRLWAYCHCAMIHYRFEAMRKFHEIVDNGDHDWEPIVLSSDSECDFLLPDIVNEVDAWKSTTNDGGLFDFEIFHDEMQRCILSNNYTRAASALQAFVRRCEHQSSPNKSTVIKSHLVRFATHMTIMINRLDVNCAGNDGFTTFSSTDYAEIIWRYLRDLINSQCSHIIILFYIALLPTDEFRIDAASQYCSLIDVANTESRLAFTETGALYNLPVMKIITRFILDLIGQYDVACMENAEEKDEYKIETIANALLCSVDLISSNIGTDIDCLNLLNRVLTILILHGRHDDVAHRISKMVTDEVLNSLRATYLIDTIYPNVREIFFLIIQTFSALSVHLSARQALVNYRQQLADNPLKKEDLHAQLCRRIDQARNISSTNKAVDRYNESIEFYRLEAVAQLKAVVFFGSDELFDFDLDRAASIARNNENVCRAINLYRQIGGVGASTSSDLNISSKNTQKKCLKPFAWLKPTLPNSPLFPSQSWSWCQTAIAKTEFVPKSIFDAETLKQSKNFELALRCAVLPKAAIDLGQLIINDAQESQLLLRSMLTDTSNSMETIFTKSQTDAVWLCVEKALAHHPLHRVHLMNN